MDSKKYFEAGKSKQFADALLYFQSKEALSSASQAMRKAQEEKAKVYALAEPAIAKFNEQRTSVRGLDSKKEELLAENIKGINENIDKGNQVCEQAEKGLKRYMTGDDVLADVIGVKLTFFPVAVAGVVNEMMNLLGDYGWTCFSINPGIELDEFRECCDSALKIKDAVSECTRIIRDLDGERKLCSGVAPHQFISFRDLENAMRLTAGVLFNYAGKDPNKDTDCKQYIYEVTNDGKGLTHYPIGKNSVDFLAEVRRAFEVVKKQMGLFLDVHAKKTRAVLEEEKTQRTRIDRQIEDMRSKMQRARENLEAERVNYSKKENIIRRLDGQIPRNVNFITSYGYWDFEQLKKQDPKLVVRALSEKLR